jgi:hypothetical protein
MLRATEVLRVVAIEARVVLRAEELGITSELPTDLRGAVRVVARPDPEIVVHGTETLAPHVLRRPPLLG